MMITLDEIIPYQPLLPPKPSISSKIIPPPSQLPPLIHPLPQKPHSRHQSPSYPSQLLQSGSHPISSPIDQESRAEVSSYQNVFDSELAAWSDMAVETTAIVSAATENTGQQSQCRSGSKGLEIDLREQPPGKYGQIQSSICLATVNGRLTYRGHCPGIRSENWQHGSQNAEASPGISAGFLEHERSCSTYQETTEPINDSESNTMHSALSKSTISVIEVFLHEYVC
jgi:hypothetical protein